MRTEGANILNNYISICKKFAEDTKEWYGLDDQTHYTTDYHGHDWIETSDNEHGGYYVAWAFQEPEEYISENAHIYLFEQIKNSLEQLLEEGFDKDQASYEISRLLRLKSYICDVDK